MQLMVEKANAGYMDPIRSALELLVDVLAIFTRVLIILMNKKQDEQNRREARRRNDGRKNR